MKKNIIICILLVFLILLISCDGEENSGTLPNGYASEVRIYGNWDLGSGTYEYMDDQNIKFIRDTDGKTYYLSMDNIGVIIDSEKKELDSNNIISVSDIRIGVNIDWDLGSGEMCYLTENLIQFIRDTDGKCYYLSMDTIYVIITNE